MKLVQIDKIKFKLVDYVILCFLWKMKMESVYGNLSLFFISYSLSDCRGTYWSFQHLLWGYELSQTHGPPNKLYYVSLLDLIASLLSS